MATAGRSTIVGVFTNRLQAFKAIEALQDAGFEDKHISFVGREGDTTPLEASVEETQAKSTTTGALGGGIIGGIIGAAGVLLIPGLGPAIAGGIFVAALGGAALGAATGGVIGTLTGMGISEEEARYYLHELEEGNMLVTVDAGPHAAEALDILRRFGAYDAHTPATTRQEFTPNSTQPMEVSIGTTEPVASPHVLQPPLEPAEGNVQEDPEETKKQ